MNLPRFKRAVHKKNSNFLITLYTCDNEQTLIFDYEMKFLYIVCNKQPLTLLAYRNISPSNDRENIQIFIYTFKTTIIQSISKL